MNTQRLISVITALIVTATFILAPSTRDGAIHDEGISSEIVLASALVHATE